MLSKQTILRRHLTRMVKFERLYVPLMAAALRHYLNAWISYLRKNGTIGIYSFKPESPGMIKVINSIYKDYGMFHARLTRRQILSTVETKAGFGVNEELEKLLFEFLQKYLLQKAVIPVTETQRKDVLAAIQLGMSKGWGVDRIIEQLEDTYALKWRARLIVRTELTIAMNAGQQAAKEESDWVTEDIWISAHDARTRHSHVLIDQYRVNENELFPVRKRKGGFDMMTGPGDPTASAENVCNCRCTKVTRAKRDSNGRLIRKRKIFVALPGEMRRPAAITI